MLPRRVWLFAIGFVAGLLVAIILLGFISYASYYPTSPSQLLAVTRASLNPHLVKTVIENKTQSLSIIDAYYEQKVHIRPIVYPDGELRYSSYKEYTVTIINNSDVPIESVYFNHYRKMAFNQYEYYRPHQNSFSYDEGYNSGFGAYQKKTIHLVANDFEAPPALSCVIFQNGAFEGDTNHLQLNPDNLAEARKAFLLIKNNLDRLLMTYPNNSQKVIDGLNDSVKNNYDPDLLLNLGCRPSPPGGRYKSASAVRSSFNSQIMGKNHAYFILNQFLKKNPLTSPDTRLEAIKNELSKFVNKLKN